MTSLDYLMRVIADHQKALANLASYRWAKVTSQNPLRIQFDGESEPLGTRPTDFVGGLKIGDRVWVLTVLRRAYILGTPKSPSDGGEGGAGSLSGVPPGTIVAYGGSSAPEGWLMCDGSYYNRTTYPELFNAIGYSFGGSGNIFAVPDTRERVIGGRGGGDSFTTLGNKIGAKTHTLTIAEMPSHSHGMRGGWGAGNYGVGFFRTDGNNPKTLWTDTYSQGGNQPHNNIQPTLVANFIIRT